MTNSIKDLLAEIERARKRAVKEWMAEDGVDAAYWSGEVSAFDFVIDRLKSILEAMEDE